MPIIRSLMIAKFQTNKEQTCNTTFIMSTLRMQFFGQTSRTARRTLLTRKLLFSLPEGAYVTSDRLCKHGWTVSAMPSRAQLWNEIPQAARQRGCTIYPSKAEHDWIWRAIETARPEHLQTLSRDAFLGLPQGAHIFYYMSNCSTPLLYIAGPAEKRAEQWTDIPPVARDAICEIYQLTANLPENLQQLIPSALTCTEVVRRAIKAATASH